MQKPIMEWNTQKKIWQYLTDNHLFELWEPFLGTWQTSGMTVNGQVYELPMPERLITDSESSSLPTPTVSDQYTANLASTQQKEGSLHSVTLAQVFHREDLFPTPTTQDGKNTGGPSQFERNTKPLNTEVLLIGTPRATAADSSSVQVASGAPKGRIEDQVKLTDWGKFEPAIRRWEQVLGRHAPAPTKPDGKDGNHRLSSEFTEWMMGVPKGWITDAGISRNEELKAAGNGVVPQQAELALRILLSDVVLE